VYDRRIAGETLTFGHSGRLYENSFVFYDKQTNSQWVHVSGKAETGYYDGSKLTFIPSTVISWQDWKKQYPDTKVLPGYGRKGFMGQYRGFYKIDNIGLVVSFYNKSKLYPFLLLKDKIVINDFIDDIPVVVVYNHNRRFAVAWRRKVNSVVHEFIPIFDGKSGLIIQDKRSKTIWNPLTGKPLNSELINHDLEQMTYNPILIERYKIHFTDGSIFSF
jgi:hypothetical protein